MPAHRALLGETRARLVAAYVWSLSHRDAAGTHASVQASP
jgi:cytochrome c oxidase cbb3-type subunit 3